jgi:hypothetical protein
LLLLQHILEVVRPVMDDIFQMGLPEADQDNLDNVLPAMRGVAGLLKVMTDCCCDNTYLAVAVCGGS